MRGIASTRCLNSCAYHGRDCPLSPLHTCFLLLGRRAGALMFRMMLFISFLADVTRAASPALVTNATNRNFAENNDGDCHFIDKVHEYRTFERQICTTTVAMMIIFSLQTFGHQVVAYFAEEENCDLNPGQSAFQYRGRWTYFSGGPWSIGPSGPGRSCLILDCNNLLYTCQTKLTIEYQRVGAFYGTSPSPPPPPPPSPSPPLPCAPS
eukprot:scaffold138351_cov28-Tisochrysis_lutea.AAC.1